MGSADAGKYCIEINEKLYAIIRLVVRVKKTMLEIDSSENGYKNGIKNLNKILTKFDEKTERCAKSCQVS